MSEFTLLAPLVPPKRSRETTSTSNLPMSEISPLNQNQWLSIYTFGSALSKKISRDQYELIEMNDMPDS